MYVKNKILHIVYGSNILHNFGKNLLAVFNEYLYV